MSVKHTTWAKHITKKQAEAIGGLTINFNWMEDCLDSLVRLIISPREFSLSEILISKMGFEAKRQLARRLIGSADHTIQQPANISAYRDFEAKLKTLLDRANQLNQFRNGFIHWRPFIDETPDKQRINIGASPNVIDANSQEMHEVVTNLLAAGLALRMGDHSLFWNMPSAPHSKV
jgi:hypothetical protein